MSGNLPFSRFLQYVLLSSFVAVVVFSSQPVRAQRSTPSDDDVNAIARQLFCPICENTPLDVCPTDACRDWRELIRQMLAQGNSQSEIKQYFVDHYGARVLAEPPRTGLNWLVYIVPRVALLIGFIFLAFKGFLKWKKLSEEKTVEAKSDSGSSAKDEYASRLEEELQRRE
jgi:cytochrome c-type biogenesis protein CcmH